MTHSFQTAILITIALACSSPSLGQTAAGPKLELSQDAWNFGEVWHPESPTMTLIVKNNGDAELKLSNLKANCGCTQAEAARNQVPPGETAEIRIQFKTEGKQDQVAAIVTFETNDPARPKVEFRITGTVKRAVRREPPAGLVIRTLDPSPGQTATVQLMNQLEEPMKLELVKCTIPALDVELKELTAGRVCQAIGRTNRPMRPGTTRGQLVFSTGLPHEERVSVTVVIQVMTLVDPVPRAIFLDPKVASEPGNRSINLNYYGTRDDFRVTGAICRQAPETKITIGAPGPAPGGLTDITPKIKYVVKTEAPMPAARDLPPGGWVIEYTTSDPAYPKLEVPITNDRKVWNEIVNGPHASESRVAPPPATP